MQPNFKAIEDCLGLFGFEYGDLERLILCVLAVDCVYDPRGYSTGPRHPELVVLELIRLGEGDVCGAVEKINRDFGVVDSLLFTARSGFSPALNRFLFCLNASLVSVSRYWRNGVFDYLVYSRDFDASVVRYEVDSYVAIIADMLEAGLRSKFVVLVERLQGPQGSLSGVTLDAIRSPKVGFWRRLFGAAPNQPNGMNRRHR